MSNKYWHLPSDLHGQGKISVETHVATTAPKWSKEDQCLLTARDQLPKQVHFPLTLPCKCSWTQRTHMASSKPQPGVRKAIAHCATAISTDSLHYQKMSPRQQVIFARKDKGFNRRTSGPPWKISTACPCILQVKALIFGQYLVTF